MCKITPYPLENFTLDWNFLHNQRLRWLWQIAGIHICHICYRQGINELFGPASPGGDKLESGTILEPFHDHLKITCTTHTTWKQFGMSPTLLGMMTSMSSETPHFIFSCPRASSEFCFEKKMKCNWKASFHPCELDLKTPEKKYDSSEIESNFFWDVQL